MIAAAPVAVARLDIRVSPEPLAYRARHAAVIEARWARAQAANPHLYDGPILLFSGVAIEPGERLVARAHRTNFAALLALVADGDPLGEAKNLFGGAAVIGSDGGIVLGVMGVTTAFPGDVKLVGGTPDEADVAADGSVDIVGSIRRELGEETGLDAAAAEIDADCAVIVDGPLVAVIARIRFPEPAAAIAARVEAFLAADPNPELAAVAVVRRGDDLDALQLPGYTRSFLVDHFA